MSLGDGSGWRFLSEAVVSPTLAGQRAQALAKYPKAKWIEYDRSPAITSAQAPCWLSTGGRCSSPVRQGQGESWRLTPISGPRFHHAAADQAFLQTPPLRHRRGNGASQPLICGGEPVLADRRECGPSLRMRGSEVSSSRGPAAASGRVAGLYVMGGAADKRAKFMAALVRI